MKRFHIFILFLTMFTSSFARAHSLASILEFSPPSMPEDRYEIPATRLGNTSSLTLEIKNTEAILLQIQAAPIEASSGLALNLSNCDEIAQFQICTVRLDFTAQALGTVVNDLILKVTKSNGTSLLRTGDLRITKHIIAKGVADTSVSAVPSLGSSTADRLIITFINPVEESSRVENTLAVKFKTNLAASCFYFLDEVLLPDSAEGVVIEHSYLLTNLSLGTHSIKVACKSGELTASDVRLFKIIPNNSIVDEAVPSSAPSDPLLNSGGNVVPPNGDAGAAVSSASPATTPSPVVELASGSPQDAANNSVSNNSSNNSGGGSSCSLSKKASVNITETTFYSLAFLGFFLLRLKKNQTPVRLRHPRR